MHKSAPRLFTVPAARLPPRQRLFPFQRTHLDLMTRHLKLARALQFTRRIHIITPLSHSWMAGRGKEQRLNSGLVVYNR